MHNSQNKSKLLIDTIIEAESYRKKAFAKAKKLKGLIITMSVLFILYLAGLFILPQVVHIQNMCYSNTILTIVLAFSMSIFKAFSYFILPLLLVYAGFWYLFLFAIKKDYSESARTLLMPVLFSEYFKETKYMSKFTPANEDMEFIKKIMPEFGEFSSKDFLSGKYEDTNVTICEAKMTFKDKDTTSIVFKGLLMTFEFDHKFNSETFIVPKKHRQIKGLLKIKHDIQDFNRIFDLYTDDSIEARELLHPDFVEKLLTLNKFALPEFVRCIFKKNKMYLSLPSSQEHFEKISKIDVPLTRECFEPTFKQIEYAIELAKTLEFIGKISL